jgi:hypothetical protein
MDHPNVRPYPPEARARVALSLAARELSDFARGLVATYADDHAQPGIYVEEAVRLRAMVARSWRARWS